MIRYKNEWILCLQTYPRPAYTADQMPRFGTGDARLYIMRSKDLQNWSKPELLQVKGRETSWAQMGRMIDPYLLEDKDEKGKWWCFYKQNGVSMSYSYDLLNWTFAGYTESGENACVYWPGKEKPTKNRQNSSQYLQQPKTYCLTDLSPGLITKPDSIYGKQP